MESPGGPSFESLRSVPMVSAWDPALWGMVSLVREAAEGVAAIHERGVVHGDIKRSNLVLTTADRATAHVKVTDVGLRRLLTPTQARRGRRLRKGRAAGRAGAGYALYEATTGRLLTSTDGAGADERDAGGRTGQGISCGARRRARAMSRRDACPTRFASAGELRDALRVLCDAEAGTLRPSSDLAVVAPAPVVTVPVRREMQVARSTRPPRPPQPSMRPGSVPTVHALDGAGAPVEVQHVRAQGSPSARRRIATWCSSRRMCRRRTHESIGTASV